MLIRELRLLGLRGAALRAQKLVVQTFGDPVIFHPHVQAFVADGVLLHSGTNRVLPPLPESALFETRRHRVLAFLRNEARLLLGARSIRTPVIEAEGRHPAQ